MYAIATKFPDQKRFQTMDIETGKQVNNWMYCTLFETKERAREILLKITPFIKPDVQLKVLKFQSK